MQRRSLRDPLTSEPRTLPCRSCGRVLADCAFHKGYKVCKLCRKADPRKNLYTWAKRRAVLKGRAFDLELSDIVIPSECPVLKIPMIVPSLDRLDSAKGYVRGNVRVISARANMLKNNATEKEMALVLHDLRKMR